MTNAPEAIQIRPIPLSGCFTVLTGLLTFGVAPLVRMLHEGTRMIARGFAPESRREEEEWSFHCDDEQRRVRRKEQARAA